MKKKDLHVDEQTIAEIEGQWRKAKYEYKDIDGSHEEYLEIIIQFGYIMIFGAAFPLAPLLAFINNLLEMRIDKYKLVYLTRRPVPHSASDIGIWKFFMEVIIYISIVTNAAYLTLTGNVFSANIRTNLPIFAFLTLISWNLKTFVYFLIPEIPK